MIIVYSSVVEQKIACEVDGEIKDIYLKSVEINPEKAPQVLDVTKLEERAERKHCREHKYTGYPVSLESISENGEQVATYNDEFAQIDLKIDFEQAIKELTCLQRYCFEEVCLNGHTQKDVARKLGKSKSVVKQAIYGARKKLKKYF